MAHGSPKEAGMRKRALKPVRTLAGCLLEEQAAMDQLISEAANVRSATHYNELETRSEEICVRFRAAFRECRSART